MEYSVVVPVFNEKDSVEILFSEIKSAFNKINATWEVIFVNDGSNDGSLDTLKAIQNESQKNVAIVDFRHNRGKSAALMAGFRAATGGIVITMDGDLQDDPKEIPAMIRKLNEGYDIVSGYKKVRHDNPFHKTIPSRIFNYLVRKSTGTNLHDINCGFKMYRREVVEGLHLYGGLYRFIPVIAASNGYTVTELPVHHRKRKYGVSKYGLSRFIGGLFDLLTVIVQTRFIKRPLHFFGKVGIVPFVIGTFICLYLAYIHTFLRATIGDRPLLLLGIVLIITGVQIVCTGILAEIVTYYQHAGREGGDTVLRR